MNKKLRNLELDEGILSQISNLLAKTSFDEEEASTEVELENNKMVQQDDYYSESSKSKCSDKEINLLTKEQDLLFEVICHLADDEQKKSYLQNIRESLDKPSSSSSSKHLPPNKYSFKEVLERFSLEVSKPITIQDLQTEINLLKNEIKELKE